MHYVLIGLVVLVLLRKPAAAAGTIAPSRALEGGVQTVARKIGSGVWSAVVAAPGSDGKARYPEPQVSGAPYNVASTPPFLGWKAITQRVGRAAEPHMNFPSSGPISPTPVMPVGAQRARTPTPTPPEGPTVLNAYDSKSRIGWGRTH